MDSIWKGEPPEMLFHCRVARRRQFLWSEGEYDCLMAILVEKGRFSYTVPTETGEAGKNDIVFFPAHTHFNRTVLESVEFHHIGFRSPEAGSGWDRLCGKYTFEDRSRVESTIRILTQLSGYTEVESCTTDRKHMAADLLYQLAFEQNKRVHHVIDCSDTVINEICAFLRENLSSPISFECLARKYGMTQVQLIRRFSKALGTTPGKYLAEQRLLLSNHLFTEGNLTVTEAAEMCGFSSAFYLSQCFKKRFGMTPTEAKGRHEIQ